LSVRAGGRLSNVPLVLHTLSVEVRSRLIARVECLRYSIPTIRLMPSYERQGFSGLRILVAMPVCPTVGSPDRRCRARLIRQLRAVSSTTCRWRGLRRAWSWQGVIASPSHILSQGSAPFSGGDSGATPIHRVNVRLPRSRDLTAILNRTQILHPGPPPREL
jgi:hypothetical protein